MIDSWFVLVARELASTCDRIKNINLFSELKACVFDFYNLPMAQVKKVENKAAERNAEGEKVCEMCGGSFKQIIKNSDVMCRHCKLEISLGRQIDDD